jgi:hypothetical protein
LGTTNLCALPYPRTGLALGSEIDELMAVSPCTILVEGQVCDVNRPPCWAWGPGVRRKEEEEEEEEEEGVVVSGSSSG